MATHLSVITGEPGTIAGYRRTADCTFCGVPTWQPCPLLEKHLGSLRMRGLSETTIYSRRRAIVRMGELLPVPLVDATAEQLMDWRAALKVEDGAAASYVCQAREVYKWFIAEGLRQDNPALKLPVPKVGRRLPRPVGEEDLMMAVRLAGERVRPWIILAAYAGLRCREIAYLRRESVYDKATPPLLLVTSMAAKGRNERLIPLSAFALDALQRAPMPVSGYVFPRHDGKKGPNNPWLISQQIREHFQELGIAASAHSCRHRFATRCYAAGHDLLVVQSLLGHVSPATTATYAQFSNMDAAAAVESLGTPGHP
jgi:site-specific recombinase XerD